MKVILLAAGRGQRFGKQTQLTPKCLVPLSRDGSTLLERYLDTFSGLGIREVVIVVGHLASQIKHAAKPYAQKLNLRFIHNKRFRRGSIVSLHTAKKELNQACLVMDADVYFPPVSLKKLIQSSRPSAFLIDPRSKSAGEEMMLMAKQGRIALIRKKIEPGLKILGEATGILKLSAKDAQHLSKILSAMVNRGVLDAEYEEAYCELLQKSRIGALSIGNVFWSEIDFPADLAKIRNHIGPK